MSEKSSTDTNSNSFIDINDLRDGVTAEQILRFHGRPVPEPKKRPNGEVRIPCPIACDNNGEYPRVISIQQSTRGFAFKCFGCPKNYGGNDVAFNDLVRDANGDGRPRGSRFRKNLADFKAMANGVEQRVVPMPATAQPRTSTRREESLPNVPLAESDNEKARELVSLHEKFVTDWAKLPPAAASYFRNRPWASDLEALRDDWHVGYLSHNTNGDRSGGTLRGRIVFPIHGLDGKLLAWCGRDPAFESKIEAHASLSETKRAKEASPTKWKFPSATVFRKGRELWGQERAFKATKKLLRKQGGPVICEGPGDVINLARAKIFAVAMMGTVPTSEQLSVIEELAVKADGRVIVLHDLDDDGRRGMMRTFEKLAPRLYVKVGWTSQTKAGCFLNRDPGSLSNEEIATLFPNATV